MRHLTPLFAAATLVLGTAPAYATNPCNQLAKLLANDAKDLDNFGPCP